MTNLTARPDRGSNPALGLGLLGFLLSVVYGFGWAQDVPAAAPFQLVDEEGEIVRLDAFRGAPLILNVWASWCAPCVEELPFFERLHGDLNRGGTPVLEVLLLNNNEDPQQAAAFVREELGLSLPLALDPTREQLERFRSEGVTLDNTLRVLKAYRVRGMPTTFFIDAEGSIQAVKVGFLSPAEAPDLLAKIGLTWQP